MLVEAVRGAGGGQPQLRWRALSAAMDQGLDPQDPRATAVIDIGGETTEIAVFTGGRLYRSRSLARGGDDLTLALMRGLSDQRGLELGWHAAEHLKRELAAADPNQDSDRTLAVEGRGRASGLPETTEVSRRDLYDWCQPELHQLEGLARQVFSHLDPEVAADLVQRGVLLIGGGGRLWGMENFLSSILGLQVRLASHPASAGARGGSELDVEPPRKVAV